MIKTTAMKSSGLYTVKELAEKYSCTEKTIYRKISSGRFKASKEDGLWLIKPDRDFSKAPDSTVRKSKGTQLDNFKSTYNRGPDRFLLGLLVALLSVGILLFSGILGFNSM